MSDFDIVKCLRDHALAMEEGMPFNDGDFIDLESAADEIIKLREDLDDARRCAANQYIKRYSDGSNQKQEVVLRDNFYNSKGWTQENK